MTTANVKYQPFINYLQNKITDPSLRFEDLAVDDEAVKIELSYDGNLAHREEQNNVREIVPEYFLMACRKGVTEEVKGIINCTENSDYLLFEFEQKWIKQMESQRNQPNWEELKNRILGRISHSYGEEPEI